MPLIDEVPQGWQLSLIDNPGFDEHTEHVTDTALQSLKFSSACFYVTTFEQYKRKETAIFFKKMYAENSGMNIDYRDTWPYKH